MIAILYVLFIVAGFSLLYWGLSQFALPQPVRVVLIVVCGLIGLVLVWNLLVPFLGGHSLNFRP